MSYPVPHFDAHFSTYRSFLEAYARQRVGLEDAEDLVCVCYQEARRSLAYYQPERNLRNWLVGILNHLLLLHFRRMRLQREERRVDFADAEADLNNIADTQSAARAQQEALHKRLCQWIARAGLTARQTDCLQRTLAGQTQQHIANCLNISQRMVSYHLAAAQRHLAALNENDDFLDPVDFFWQCADHPIYRKPHSFDNQGTSEEREQRLRRACGM